MGKGNGRVKTIKPKNAMGGDMKELGKVFGDLFSGGSNMDFEIALDKLKKLKSNVVRVQKFLESFDKSVYGKVMSNDTFIKTYRTNIQNFVEDCKTITDYEEYGKTINEVVSFYQSSKENKVVKDCIGICRRIVRYKKYLEDIDNLDDSFLRSSNLADLKIFPFCDFDIKYLYVYGNIDESVKKYIMIFLSMILKSTKEIFEVVTSPDIDIDKMSKIVVEVIASTKKLLPRCGKAFDKIEKSLDLLKNNFGEYYKDMVSSKDQSVIISNFIADCSKDTGDGDEDEGNVDIELTRQFAQITNFFRKNSAGKIKDPRVNELLNFLDKQFKSLDIDEDEDNSSD
jgi:predicted translin family RNA/ssDNA-binding protein